MGDNNEVLEKAEERTVKKSNVDEHLGELAYQTKLKKKIDTRISESDDDQENSSKTEIRCELSKSESPRPDHVYIDIELQCPMDLPKRIHEDENLTRTSDVDELGNPVINQRKVGFDESKSVVLPYVPVDLEEGSSEESLDTNSNNQRGYLQRFLFWKKDNKLAHVDSKILALDREFNKPTNELDVKKQAGPFGPPTSGPPIYVQGGPLPPDISKGQGAFRSNRPQDSYGPQYAAYGRNQYDPGNPYGGGYSRGSRAPYGGDEDSIQFMAFTDVAVRNAFVRKVYTILSVQLIVTFGFVVLATHQEDVGLHMRAYGIVIGLPVSIVAFIPLVCCDLRRHFPINFILLAIYTAGTAMVCASLSCLYSTKIVYMAFGATAIVTITVTLFAIQTKWDVTECGASLYIILIALLVYGVVIMFVSLLVTWETLRMMEVIYSAIACVLFSAFLMYDTQQIMGGRRIELSPEEYILGAIELYIDIINIFINLLNILRCVEE